MLTKARGVIQHLVDGGDKGHGKTGFKHYLEWYSSVSV